MLNFLLLSTHVLDSLEICYDLKDLVAILADRCSLCSRNHDLPSTGQKSSSGIKADEYAAISHQNVNLPSTGQIDDDDDDFDPRGTAATSMFWVSDRSQVFPI